MAKEKAKIQKSKDKKRINRFLKEEKEEIKNLKRLYSCS